AETARADPQPLGAPADLHVHALEIRPPQPLRLVVRVADVVSGRGMLSTDAAGGRHGGGAVACAPGCRNVRSDLANAPQQLARGHAGDEIDALDATAPAAYLGRAGDVLLGPVGP